MGCATSRKDCSRRRVGYCWCILLERTHGDRREVRLDKQTINKSLARRRRLDIHCISHLGKSLADFYLGLVHELDCKRDNAR